MSDETTELKIARDPKSNRIIGYTAPSDESEKMLTGLLAASVDALNIELDKFSKSSDRQSNILIRLTKVLIVLTFALFVLAVSQAVVLIAQFLAG